MRRLKKDEYGAKITRWVHQRGRDDYMQDVEIISKSKTALKKAIKEMSKDIYK